MPDIFISENKEEEKPVKAKEDVKKTKKKILSKETFSYGGLEPMLTKNPLSSFHFFPDEIDFETRDNEEKVILFLRKHQVTNIPWLVVTGILVIAPAFFSGLSFVANIPSNFLFIFTLMWYLLTLIFFLEKFLTWYFNVNIITDERIIDFDFYNLIYKDITEAKIDKIQDVNYKTIGVIRTLLNMGDVFVQTASEVPNIEFTAIPKPDKVVRVLQDLRTEEEREAIEGRVR